MARTPIEFSIGGRACGEPLVTAPLAESCRAIIILPVRNEEDRVVRCLQALARQVELDGVPLQKTKFEIIILLNNCTDCSEQQVRAFSAAHPFIQIHPVVRDLPSPRANIGYVRRLLMDEACRRLLQHGRGDGAILSTDADTVVRQDWMARNCRALRAGADGVGGRIILDPLERLSLPPAVQKLYLLDIAYHLLSSRLEATINPNADDPWPRHYQNFSASLGVTAQAYHAAGGVPDVVHLEDVALWKAMLRMGAHLRHDPQVVVETSARMSGRASAGLATHLLGLSQHPGQRVEAAEMLRQRFTATSLFRKAWEARYSGEHVSDDDPSRFQQLEALTGVRANAWNPLIEREVGWHSALLASNIGERVAGRVPEAERTQTLQQAVASLRSILFRK